MRTIRIFILGAVCILVAPFAFWGQAALWGQNHGKAHAQANKPAAGSAWVVLLAAGDLRGEIKPCGCSPEGQMGGLPRRLTYLAQWMEKQGEPPLLIDLGNNFPEPSEQGRLKTPLIQNLLARYAPSAILPGPNELAMGLNTLNKRLPYLLSNSQKGKTFPRFFTVKRLGIRIGLYGYLSPKAVYQGAGMGIALQPAARPLFRLLEDTMKSQRHQQAVLLFRGDDTELAALAATGLFAAIVVGNPFSDEMNQVTVRKVVGLTLPQVPTKGQGLLRISLQPAGQARGGLSANRPARVDWLKGNYEDHPLAVRALKDYDEQVKKLFFARMTTLEKQRKTTPFVGAEACKSCHQPAFAVWEKTRHAGAIKTLVKVGKQFDPECLACHVVGLEKGGYLSQEITPTLASVQCENCHGAGKEHSAKPQAKLIPPLGRAGPQGRDGNGNLTLTMARPGEPICRTCHVGSHSPAFDFKIYWPKILHK